MGRIAPYIAACICLRDQAGQLGPVVTGRVRHRPGADQAVTTIDADMVLVAEGGRRQVDARRPVVGRDHFTVQRASRSFCASLAGLSAHPAGMRPSLMSRFSASVLRCLGAAMMEASTIWPPIARKPARDRAAS